MKYSPDFGFWLSIPRIHVKTLERFEAIDPWDDDHRISTFTVDDYVLAGSASCSMPTIRSASDGVTRLLPDSLCDLYLGRETPGSVLPALLKEIEDSLIRSDFLAVARNWAFLPMYRLCAMLCSIVLLGTGLTLYGLEIRPAFAAILMLMMIAACSGWLYLSFQRKLIRRKQQRAHLLVTLQAMGRSILNHPVAAISAAGKGTKGPESGLLDEPFSLDVVEASLRAMMTKIGVNPAGLPTFGRKTFDGWYVEVDRDYHLFVQDRGVDSTRFTTSSLDELQFRIVREVLRDVGRNTRKRYQIEGTDPLRIWDQEQSRLLRQISPAWGERWDAEVNAGLIKQPYNDGLSKWNLGADSTQAQVLLNINRDSVCMSDDIKSHECQLSIASSASIVKLLQDAMTVCPLAAGGTRVTWHAAAVGRDSFGTRSIALLASQWVEPQFLMSPSETVGSLFSEGLTGVYFSYRAQSDPEVDLKALRETGRFSSL